MRQINKSVLAILDDNLFENPIFQTVEWDGGTAHCQWLISSRYARRHHRHTKKANSIPSLFSNSDLENGFPSHYHLQWPSFNILSGTCQYMRVRMAAARYLTPRDTETYITQLGHTLMLYYFAIKDRMATRVPLWDGQCQNSPLLIGEPAFLDNGTRVV